MPAAAATTAIRPARPGLSVGGRDQPSLADGLIELRVDEDVDGLSRCELSVGNWGPVERRLGFLYFDRALLDFGKELAVTLGDGSLFRGRVTGLEAHFPEGRPPALTVLAEDRLQDLRMTRRTRAFADLSDADLVRRVAAEHGLQAEVDLDGPTHRTLAQLNQSDLAFLRERARAAGAELWVEGTTLKAKRRPDRGTGALRLGYGNELRAFTVLADLAGQRTSVTVSGWDVGGKAALAETADEGVLGAELGDGVGGARALGDALGERRETVAHAVPLTGPEARARAGALFRARARRFLCGRGVAQCDARLRVGARPTLEGLGPLFSGAYQVVAVTHRFDGAEGLRTEFTAERAAMGRPS